MSDEGAATGTLENALKQATALAVEQALAILEAVPAHPPAILLLARARRALGDLDAANGILEDLVEARPRWAPAQVEHAIVLGSRGQGDAAIAALRRALAINSEHPEARRLLGDHLMATGDTEGADAAYARHVKASTRDPAYWRRRARCFAMTCRARSRC